MVSNTSLISLVCVLPPKYMHLFIFIKVFFVVSDTAGQSEYREMTQHYCRNADVAILGFALNSTTSFLEVDDFLQIARPHCKVLVAVGNKVDLASEREVSTADARAHFEKMSPPIRYFETSAKTGENVNEVFEYAIREWRDHGGVKNDNYDALDDDKKCIIA